MPIRRKRGYRTYTVSFPPELAEMVDEIAEREQRQISELFREAFRLYANLPVGDQIPVALPGALSASSDFARSRSVRRELGSSAERPKRATS